MMKLKIVFALFVMVLTTSFVAADYSTVIQKVDKFNNLNNGQGIQFTIQVDPYYSSSSMGSVWQGEIRVNMTGEMPDLSAYSSQVSGSNYFQTFCIQAEQYIYQGTDYSGALNLTPENGGYYSKTIGLGSSALTEGTATLYRLFATGELQQYDYVNSHGHDAAEFQAALWKLQGQTANSVTALTLSDWSANKYLSQLIDMNSDINAWLNTYDPTTDTSGYVVFAMNNEENITGKFGQNFLYVAQDSPVPEPTTFCLWGVGLGTGLLWRRWKNQKNQS